MRTIATLCATPRRSRCHMNSCMVRWCQELLPIAVGAGGRAAHTCAAPCVVASPGVPPAALVGLQLLCLLGCGLPPLHDLLCDSVIVMLAADTDTGLCGLLGQRMRLTGICLL